MNRHARRLGILLASGTYTIVAGKQVPLNQFYEDMKHFDVQLLNSICKFARGRADVNITQLFQHVTAISRKHNDAKADRLC